MLGEVDTSLRSEGLVRVNRSLLRRGARPVSVAQPRQGSGDR